MPTYVTLFKWTDQGIRSAGESPDRVEQASQQISQAGGRLLGVYWTQGEYDLVAIGEWPDEETAMAFLLALGGRGNVRTQTLRAFSADEMRRVLDRVPSARASVTAKRGEQAVEHAGDAIASHVQHTTTAHFVITFSRSLGADGPAVAQRIAAACEADYSRLQEIFGGITPAHLPFRIRLTPGSSGASHASCLATELLVGVRSAPRGDPDFVNALVVAEEDEVFMANFGRGWDCGASNGEGLSRVLSNELHPGTEPPDFVSAPVWLDHGRPNFVNETDPTDTNYVSIGCAVLFLNWLHSQLGHSWRDIVGAGGPTLADTYRQLGEAGDGWTRFRRLIDQRFPPGRPSGLTTDNPFPVA